MILIIIMTNLNKCNHDVIDIEIHEGNISNNNNKIKYNCKTVFYLISFSLILVFVVMISYGIIDNNGFVNKYYTRFLKNKEDLEYIQEENDEIKYVVMIAGFFIILLIFTCLCDITNW